MGDKKGAALHMVWAQNIPADKDEEFNRWYDVEHIPEILTMPGFLSAARYRALSGSPTYVACYEMEGPDVFESEANRRRREYKTEWTWRMLPNVLGVGMGNVWRQIFPAEVPRAAAESDMAPYLRIERVNVPAEAEGEFNEWYNAIFPSYEKVRGCIRVRRYAVMSGSGHTEQKYMVVYELENENVFQSPEWTAVEAAHPQSARMLPLVTHGLGSPGMYKNITPK